MIFKKFLNFLKYLKITKENHVKKNLGKANLQLSERSEPRIPRVYRVPKAPSMRVRHNFIEEKQFTIERAK